MDRLGRQHVRFQQTHFGLPVVGGNFIVRLLGARAMGAYGHIVTGLPETVAAVVPAPSAIQTAAEVFAKMHTGVLLQGTGGRMADDQTVTSTFELGNSSGRRQRVTIRLYEGDFRDIAACTFWIPPSRRRAP